MIILIKKLINNNYIKFNIKFKNNFCRNRNLNKFLIKFQLVRIIYSPKLLIYKFNFYNK